MIFFEGTAAFATTDGAPGSAAPRVVSPLMRWLLDGHIQEPEAAYEPENGEHGHHTHPWWKVMCLTGVDYFSTLGYQPGIAALAAGALSPFATLILVLLTLFGALPMYKRVAGESPHGEGSISMLERLLSKWSSKLFVLCLLGFVATDFIITITLSAADATAHIVENPFTPAFLHGHNIGITLFLVAILAAVFLKGFKEAIGIAVVLVGAYLALNMVVLGVGTYHVLTEPYHLPEWKKALFTSHGNPLMMLAVSLILFPKLALGMSGFETGVVVMPLVQGDPGETEENPVGRIRNTRQLLTVAAIIMSVFLMFSSVCTTLLIPADKFLAATATAPAGPANGRALAYMAHFYMGDAFGTVYDISTVFILWFAGASAMAGLLNVVPRYLPRYGMAPEWARATRPLVLIFAAIAFVVTIAFKANVDAQGGAYATGVLVLMTSAAIAVTLAVRKRGQKLPTIAFAIITLVFLYTTVVNVVERPEGLKIASFFIAAIVFLSFWSRVSRSTELRVERVEMDEVARSFIDQCSGRGVRVIANKRQEGDAREYALKEDKQREDSHIPASLPILFLEVDVTDASEFSSALQVHGVEIGDYKVLRAQSATVPNAIAALLLHLRDMTGKRPHAYFNWSEGNPIVFMMRYLLLGEGDTAPVTREVLRKAEPDVERRPMIHVDG